MAKKGRILLLSVLVVWGVIGGVVPLHDAFGGVYTCRKVAQGCESSNNIEYGSCLGYLAGLSGWEIFLQVNLEKHRVFCFPEVMKTGQLKKIFLRYLEKHPEQMDSAASLCFFEAMSEAFPCRPAAPPSE
ncbi:MAG: hypothetical protein HQL72_00520 [Magnetococcales bacterium]|nr:hypothetical protein [Magnetococcales bacterium]